MSKKTQKISIDKLKNSNKEEYKTNYTPKKYHSSFLNIVNKDAHSTRPETVGKLATDIFPKYVEETVSPSPENSEKHYKDAHLEQYQTGLKKFKDKFEQEKKAINEISDDDLTNWYDDLMFNKTFFGLYAESAILKDIAEKNNATYKKSSAAEESQGIDGYIDDVAYSVKAETYKDSSAHNTETINAKMVYYRNTYDSNNKVDGVEYYIEEEDKK